MTVGNLYNVLESGVDIYVNGCVVDFNINHDYATSVWDSEITNISITSYIRLDVEIETE